MFTPDTKKRINELKEVESSTFYRTRNNPDNLFYLNNKMDSSTIYGVDKDYFDTVGYVKLVDTFFSVRREHCHIRRWRFIRKVANSVAI